MQMEGKFGGKAVSWIIFLLLILLGILIGKKRFSGNKKSTPAQSAVYYEKITATSQFPTDTIIKGRPMPCSLPLTIAAKNNFENYETRFFISNDTSVTIKGTGEAASFSTNPDMFWSFDNDGVELFFDMKNDKASLFDIKNDDRQYRVLWKTNEIYGQNIVKTGVKIIETDLTATAYSLILSFPWKTLGFVKPSAGSKFGFDVAIMDSDYGAKKSLLNWYSKSPDNWKNTSYYGTVLLSKDNNSNSSPGVAKAVRSLENKQIGTEEFRGPSYKINNLTVGYNRGPKDCSGSFQVQWDQKNFYVKIAVNDNEKSLAHAIFDYGWIEDMNGRVLWKMDFSNMRHAGGAMKNFISDGNIRLKRGRYKLRYHTDESHAPGKWDDSPPDVPFYGIKVSYK